MPGLGAEYGFGAWSDETSLKLFGDALHPIAAPAFAERHAGATAADLPQLPLLHIDWVDPDWTGWDESLRRGDVAGDGLKERRFSTFNIVMQACKDGQGTAVGWHRLVAPLVSSGELTRFAAPTIHVLVGFTSTQALSGSTWNGSGTRTGCSR